MRLDGTEFMTDPLPTGLSESQRNGEYVANLLVTLMDKLGVPVNKLGGSTGRLEIDTLSGV